MVAAPIYTHPHSLENWLENPPSGTEWVNGELVEKTGMTLKHSKLQRRLSTVWSNYKDDQGLGGEVYTDVPCRTQKQGRSPDVAYLTPDLLTQYGDAQVLPQSFPLSAEVVSPTDLAEEVILKAKEYLASGGLEVWLIYPESQWVIIVTAAGQRICSSGETVATTCALPGFKIAVNELLV
ncbi:MAG: Uma2 family endonuclease [Cyanobacteria bacterium P01_A01_bin.114]